MSNISNLLQDSKAAFATQRNETQGYVTKWEKTGLLEGLGGEYDKHNTAILLENQAKQLISEANNTATANDEWNGVALPLVRRIFAEISAKDFVSVQPMNLPSGLVFFLDFQYGSDKSPFSAGDSLYGNGTADSAPFGNTNAGGLYGEGRFGYSINNTASIAADASAPLAAAAWSDFDYDSAYSQSSVDGDYWKVLVPTASLDFVDKEGVAAFQLFSGSQGYDAISASAGVQVSAFTRYDGGANITFVVPKADLVGAGPVAFAAGDNVSVVYQLQPTDQYRGDFEDNNPEPNGLNSPAINIPEINVQMKSSAIVAKTRKLKAVWTPEFAQDLNAYHALDAEAELTSILSEYISLEIDLEILGMLLENAAAGNEVWSAVNNRSIVDDGANGTISDLGFYNSQGQWFQTLGTKIQKLSNIIHQKTLRGGANFLVCSPSVGTILESIPGFAADTDGDAAKATYAFGVQKVGQLNGRYKVYKNPYMTSNKVLLGFRGSQFLETGAVFAPYIPLIMTPLVYDPNTFTPRKGLLTRYAKKMVRPEFYGTIEINGLNTL